MENNAEREAFEDFVRKQGGSVMKRDGKYRDSMTRLWWTCWQARAELDKPAQQSQVDGWREGIEAVAKMIEKQALDYAMEFGSDDLGAMSFGAGPRAEAKHDHYSTLCELAEEVRALLGGDA